MNRARAATVAAAVLTLVLTPTAARAGGDGGAGGGAGGDGGQDGKGVEVVAEGLDGPRQVNGYRDDALVVAESDTGEVSAVDPDSGRVRTLLDGLPNPQGVDDDRGRLYVALGEAFAPEEGEEAPETEVSGQSLLVAAREGDVLDVHDLLAYELENNPDGQEQFDENGEPVETLSNPFAVQALRDRILVADAGANAVLAVDRDSGEISTFFVPPVVTPEEVAGCADVPNNPGTVGCDPVPTGVDEENGLVYVTTLGAEVPGAARVYVLERDGDLVDTIEGLSGIAGVAVDSDGTVYVSELFAGAPAEEPGPDFDPTPVGRIVEIEPDGDRAYAQVTLPAGLEFEDGELYAAAWSIAGFLGLPGRGEIVRVGEESFGSTP